MDNQAVCSCLPEFFGVAPHCKRECAINNDCDRSLACINHKCQNPCINSCGRNAECSVVDHNAVCTCQNGYEGDPTSYCSLIPLTCK